MRALQFTFALLLSVVAGSCGGGGSGEVIDLNPGDGLPSETFQGMDVADMNRDGLPDIVSASRYFDGVSSSEYRLNVFLQDTANPGRFLPRSYVVHTEGANIWQVAAADLDLDGVPEVLLSAIDFAGISVFVQDASGPGPFLPPQRYGLQSGFNPDLVGSFDVADIDGDLYPDVVATVGTDAVYFRQDSALPGSFHAGVRVAEGAGDIQIVDVDGDGLRDLVTFKTHPNDDNLQVEDTWHFLRQNPSAPASFLAPVAGFFDSVGWAMEVADLSNDGRADISVNSAKGDNEYLFVFRQTPFNSFERLTPVATRLDALLGDMATADLDDDGLPEIVAAMNTAALDPNLIQIYRQDGGAVYRAGEVLTIPYPEVGQPFIYALRVLDMNGDDQPDIVVSTQEIFIFFQRTGSPGIFDGPTVIAAQR